MKEPTSLFADVPAGVIYTLATGRLFCPIADFHAFAERLAGHPIWTHEFADEATWSELREAFETQITEEMRRV